VGFTGSYHGGMALFRAAAARPQPIPVYAEMGSLNPAFVYPGAIGTRAPELASELAGSITQGGGQFCTKPGLIIVPPDADDFVEMLKGALKSLPAQPLLNTSISELLHRRVRNSLATKVAAPSDESWQARTASCNPLLLELTGDDLLTHRDVLLDEHFGPVSLVVRHEPSHWPRLAAQLPGSLSAAINATDDDLDQATELQAALLDKVGRVVWNAATTGVAVVPSMHHGGPFPATTSPLHSSVGWHAVRRFLRPVAIQGAPTSALPPALLDETMPRLQNSTPAM
jgi:NADP-dependent aldehyde dehydrogenase